ncbi:AlbA family DNA-binding domain-containing protein [Rhizobium leguminosarum]|uniref:Schlafen AlbA-2 domain-containing protein n=1 Tax=Rhizobium leguminosarum TaxID=384 RepID=A0A7W9ZY71_RHILE|nr:ATP-binding protein [Rhizobium leguminosarum]MBB6224987.1 hypothetical protein [Rhizobium leguminosarum]
MSFVKKEHWTEEDVLSLPAGEHDYFDRKSGQLFDDPSKRDSLYDVLAKAACAFANSGGGHLVLGVKDDGTVDGVPAIFSGRTSTREWLEQKLPDFLDYRLVDFRVHSVAPAATSKIPAGRELLVVDFGDSSLAPHQSRRHLQYFYRSGSHSSPAPHFYLELLRQRLTNPSLDFTLSNVTIESGWSHEGAIILKVDAGFVIENTGRIAAYKWSLIARELSGVPEGRAGDYFFSGIPGATRGASSIRIDDTILPGGLCPEKKTFGVRLRPENNNEAGIRDDLAKTIGTMSLTLQLATETSRGELKTVDIGSLFCADRAVELLREKGMVFQ